MICSASSAENPTSWAYSRIDGQRGLEYSRPRRIAYERLLFEAIKNNQTLFVRRDEAEAAWMFVDAIIDGWQRYGVKPAGYAAGSWGPSGAFGLTERNGHSWYE